MAKKKSFKERYNVIKSEIRGMDDTDLLIIEEVLPEFIDEVKAKKAAKGIEELQKQKDALDNESFKIKTQIENLQIVVEQQKQQQEEKKKAKKGKK